MTTFVFEALCDITIEDPVVVEMKMIANPIRVQHRSVISNACYIDLQQLVYYNIALMCFVQGVDRCSRLL